MLYMIKPTVLFPLHSNKVVTIYPVGLVEGEDEEPDHMGFETSPSTSSEGLSIIWSLNCFTPLTDAEPEIVRLTESLNVISKVNTTGVDYAH